MCGLLIFQRACEAKTGNAETFALLIKFVFMTILPTAYKHFSVFGGLKMYCTNEVASIKMK